MRIRERWSRRRSALVAGALVVGLLVAGCSDAGGDVEQTAGPPPAVPPPEVTETAVPTESPTDSATEPATEPATPAPGPTPWPEPTRPEAMERDDIEGAKAAAEYFLALFPYVHETGDLDQWREVTHAECMFCEDVANAVEELHSNGGYADGPAIDVASMEVTPPDDERAFYFVGVEAQEAASSTYDERGAVVTKVEASTVQIDIALTQEDGKWLVLGSVGTTQVEEESDG